MCFCDCQSRKGGVEERVVKENGALSIHGSTKKPGMTIGRNVLKGGGGQKKTGDAWVRPPKKRPEPILFVPQWVFWEIKIKKPGLLIERGSRRIKKGGGRLRTTRIGETRKRWRGSSRASQRSDAVLRKS